jgi:hypothetical protein
MDGESGEMKALKTIMFVPTASVVTVCQPSAPSLAIPPGAKTYWREYFATASVRD